MRAKKFAVLAAAVAGAAVLSQRANAAVITWTVNTISGDTDVIDPTAGQQLVAAYCFGNSWATAASVNGVSFSAYPTGTTATNVNISFTSVYGTGTPPYNLYSSGLGVSTNYKDILSQANYGSGSGTVTLTGLTQNDSYEVEVWAQDDRTENPARAETLTGTTNATLEVNTGNALGQYAIGTFVADGNTQIIALTPNSANVIQINDIELVQQGVPEPAPLSFLAVGAGAALLIRRRRRGEEQLTAGTEAWSTDARQWPSRAPGEPGR